MKNEEKGKWSPWLKQTQIFIPALSNGNYSLEIRAQQHGGDFLRSKTLTLKFNIFKPSIKLILGSILSSLAMVMVLRFSRPYFPLI